MKKLTTLFVIALLVLSLAPAVFAEEDTDVETTDHADSTDDVSTDEERTDGLSADEVDAINADIIEQASKPRTRNEIRKLEQAKFDEARKELKTRAELRRTELIEKRESARAQFKHDKDALRARHKEFKEKLRDNKERFKAIREEYKNKREEIKQQREASRERLGEIRGKLRDCAGDESVDCKETRSKARGHATDFLNRAAEHIIAVLEKTRERIENSDLSDEKKAEILSEIDAALEEAVAAKETVAELGEDATKEDLKDAASIIRDSWKQAKDGIKHGVGKVASKRIGGVIKKMEKLDTKFDRIIARLDKAGKDTSAVDAKKADFNAKLESAKALHAEAEALFNSGDKSGAAAKIREAHAELKDAHVILKDLVQDIRGTGGSDALKDEAEEAEEEAEDAVDDAEDAADEAEDEAEEAEEEAEEADDESEEESEDEEESEEESDDESEDEEESEEESENDDEADE